MLVFVVIVGTGNHYVLDCIVGALTFVFAAAVAAVVHGHAPAPARLQTSGIASIALGYALIAWGFVSLDLTELGSWDNLVDVLVLAAGFASPALTPRLGEKEPLTETR